MNNVGVVELVDTDQWGKAVNKSVGQQNAGSSPASDNRRIRDRRGIINIQRQAI